MQELWPAAGPPQGLWQDGLPLVAAAIVVVWEWLPCLQVVQETARTGRRQLACMLAIVVFKRTAWHLAGYLSAALGRVADLETLAELPRHRDARYFWLRHWPVDNRGVKFGAFVISSS